MIQSNKTEKQILPEVTEYKRAEGGRKNEKLSAFRV